MHVTVEMHLPIASCSNICSSVMTEFYMTCNWFALLDWKLVNYHTNHK